MFKGKHKKSEPNGISAVAQHQSICTRKSICLGRVRLKMVLVDKAGNINHSSGVCCIYSSLTETLGLCSDMVSKLSTSCNVQSLGLDFFFTSGLRVSSIESLKQVEISLLLIYY